MHSHLNPLIKSQLQDFVWKIPDLSKPALENLPISWSKIYHHKLYFDWNFCHFTAVWNGNESLNIETSSLLICFPLAASIASNLPKSGHLKEPWKLSCFTFCLEATSSHYLQTVTVLCYHSRKCQLHLLLPEICNFYSFLAISEGWMTELPIWWWGRVVTEGSPPK